MVVITLVLHEFQQNNITHYKWKLTHK